MDGVFDWRHSVLRHCFVEPETVLASAHQCSYSPTRLPLGPSIIDFFKCRKYKVEGLVSLSVAITTWSSVSKPSKRESNTAISTGRFWSKWYWQWWFAAWERHSWGSFIQIPWLILVQQLGMNMMIYMIRFITHSHTMFSLIHLILLLYIQNMYIAS